MTNVPKEVKISNSFLHNAHETTIGIKITFPPDYKNPEAIPTLAKHLEDEVNGFLLLEINRDVKDR